MLWQKLIGATPKTTGITFVASSKKINTAAGARLNIQKPSDTVGGDLMIAVMAANTAGTTWDSSGWTEVYDQGANPRLRIAYRVATVFEGSSYDFDINSSTAVCGGTILTYRNSIFDVIGSGATSSGSTPITAPSVSVAGGVLLACYAQSGTTTTAFTTPSGMTPVVNNLTGPNFAVFSESRVAGATGTRSSTPSGSSAPSAGILLSIKPS